MLTDPVPITPRGRGNRARLLATIATPLVLLVLVVGFGANGPARGELDPSAGASDRAGEPGASTAETTIPPTSDPPRSFAFAFPLHAVGVPVIGVDRAAEQAASGDGGVVAVSGWLAMDPDSPCAAGGPVSSEALALAESVGVAVDPSAFCVRSGVLRPSALSFTAFGFDEAGRGPAGVGTAHLHVAVVPGTTLIYPATEARIGTPVQVVLVGRLERRAPDCDGDLRCEPRFVVDRSTWAAGRTGRGAPTTFLPRVFETEPGLDESAREALIVEALGSSGRPLFETLVDIEGLAVVDPAAAELVGAAVPRSGSRIWYRRVVVPDAGPGLMRWVAIDDAAGVVLASGVVPGT